MASQQCGFLFRIGNGLRIAESFVSFKLFTDFSRTFAKRERERESILLSIYVHIHAHIHEYTQKAVPHRIIHAHFHIPYSFN